MSLRTRFFLLVALGSIVTATAAYVLHFRFLDNLERQTIDLRFSLRGDEAPPADIVIVKVDDVTFQEMPKYRWPYPRTLHAKLLDQIRKGKPAALAVDLQFSEFGTAREDNALGFALQRNRGRTVLATTEVNERGEPNVIFGPEALKQLGARAGNSNFNVDKDGGQRRFPYEIDGLKSFAVVATEVASGKRIERSDMGASNQWIDYAGSPGTVTSYSYSRVLNGQVSPSVFKDKVVVIGATAPTLHDLHTTPTGTLMPGPEVHANAIETALRGFPLRSLPNVWNIVLIVALGALVPLVSLRAGPLVAVAVGIVGYGLFSLGTQLAFEQGGKVSSYVYPTAALAMATVGSVGAHYTLAAFERERVRDVFSRFVPEQVVDQVLAQADADLRLHGKELVTTVMFSDLRGFTSSAEDMPAENVITVLNYYLQEMSEAILAPWRHARLLHGRRHLRHLGRAAGAGESRRPCARRVARDAAGAPAEVQRVDARAGLRRGLPHGYRAQLRAGNDRQRRPRAADGLHGRRRRREHRLPHRGHDEGHAVLGADRRVDDRDDERAADGSRLLRRARDPRAHREAEALGARHPQAGRRAGPCSRARKEEPEQAESAAPVS